MSRGKFSCVRFQCDSQRHRPDGKDETARVHRAAVYTLLVMRSSFVVMKRSPEEVVPQMDDSPNWAYHRNAKVPQGDVPIAS